MKQVEETRKGRRGGEEGGGGGGEGEGEGSKECFQ